MQISKRYFREMSEMFGLPHELYTMKRGVKTKGDFRYDITIIPPLIINGHYNKTKGHYHPSGHTELYQVLKGDAFFLFQKGKEHYSVKAYKGSEVVIPKGYYHNTTNIGKTTLKLANWIHKDAISDYKLIEKKKGMRYYYTTKGWVKNPNYK